MTGVGRAVGCVGVALVFAIDSSGSIDRAEYDLQIRGIGLALQSADALAAIEAAGGLAVSAVVWADETDGIRSIGWQSITTKADAQRFAGRLLGIPYEDGGNTDLGGGLAAALRMFDVADSCAVRRVIDVSGDGRETLVMRRRSGVSLREARIKAEALGVTINGLAVTSEEPDVAAWYRRHVISGPGAFVIEARSFADFARAMESKLLREIAGTPSAAPPGAKRRLASGAGPAGLP